MNEPINIVCATDKNFVPYAGIMLTSAFESHKTYVGGVSAYILVDESVGKEDLAKLDALSEKYHQSIEIISVDSSIFDNYPTTEAWSKAMYYRLLIADLLPLSVDKIFYFDCDIIVTRSLEKLWNRDISHYAVGAVVDVWTEGLSKCSGLSDTCGYFNTGSMLINLTYWRQYNIGERCMEVLTHTKKEDLICPDQDVLNKVLENTKLLLPITYNFQVQFLRKEKFDSFDESLKQEIISTSASTPPHIIHYAYNMKPWMMLCDESMPYYSIWHAYKKISLWKCIPKVYPKSKRLNWWIKRYILLPLGFIPPLLGWRSMLK